MAEFDDMTKLYAAYYSHNRRRRPKGRDVDNGTSARVTKNFSMWWSQPNRYDLEGVDTRKRAKPPAGYTPSKGKKAANKIDSLFGSFGGTLP